MNNTNSLCKVLLVCGQFEDTAVQTRTVVPVQNSYILADNSVENACQTEQTQDKIIVLNIHLMYDDLS